MSNNQESKRGISGRKNRIRTAPSGFLVMSLSITVSVIATMFRKFLHLYASLIPLSDAKPHSALSSKVRAYVPELPFSGILPVAIPNILVPFKKSNLTDISREMMEAIPRRTIMANTGNHLVYLLDQPTLSDVRTILESDAIIDEDFESTRRYVHVKHFGAYHTLLSRISVIAQALYLLPTENPDDLGNGTSNWQTKIRKDTITHANYEYADDDEVKRYAVELSGSIVEQEHQVGTNGGGPVAMAMTLFPRTDRSKKAPWSTLTALPSPPSTHGHLLPFERNFANPDTNGFIRFLEAFPQFFSPQDSGMIIEAWSQSIYLSIHGDWLAHIMKTLVCASTSEASPHILVDTSSQYIGSILYTTNALYTLKESHTALSIVDLQTDIDGYKFHDSEIGRLVALFAIRAPVSTITSMRALRALCVPGTDLPDTATMRSASRMLSNLNFPQMPLTGTPPDWELVIELLRNPTMAIPDTLFLHHEAFFETDRVKLVLSAFGETVPTIVLGSARVRVSTITSPEAEKGTALPPYNGSGPKVLQTKMVALNAASSHWRSVMRNGFAAIETEVHLPDSRVYSGFEKTHLWGLINQMCITTVAEGLSTGSGGAGSKGKRKGPDDGFGEGGKDAAAQKKAKNRRMFA